MRIMSAESPRKQTDSDYNWTDPDVENIDEDFDEDTEFVDTSYRDHDPYADLEEMEDDWNV